MVLTRREILMLVVSIWYVILIKGIVSLIILIVNISTRTPKMYYVPSWNDKELNTDEECHLILKNICKLKKLVNIKKLRYFHMKLKKWKWIKKYIMILALNNKKKEFHKIAQTKYKFWNLFFFVTSFHWAELSATTTAKT